MKIKTKYARNKKQAIALAEKIKSEIGYYPYICKVNPREFGYGINYRVEYQIHENGETGNKGSDELVIAH